MDAIARIRQALERLQVPAAVDAFEPIAADPPPERLVITQTIEGDEGHVTRTTAPTAAKGLGRFFQDPAAHPVALDLLLLQRYGPDWMLWEDEVLLLKIRRDFNVLTVSELAMDKIHAAKTLHFNERYWNAWEVFVWCTMPFCGYPTDFHIMQVPTVEQCAVSVDTANRLRGDEVFGWEVKEFIATVFRHDEIWCPQPPLDFITLTPPDTVDTATIMAEWPAICIFGRPPTEDTVVAEQLRRMLAVHQHVLSWQARLRRQLEVIQNG